MTDPKEALIERLRKSSEFLRQSVTPPAPIPNTVRQSIADAIADALASLSASVGVTRYSLFGDGLGVDPNGPYVLYDEVTKTPNTVTDEMVARAREAHSAVFQDVLKQCVVDALAPDRQEENDKRMMRAALQAALSLPPSGGEVVAPVCSVKTMKLSDGRADYFVSVKVGGREITPYVFREKWKADYESATLAWLFRGGTKPQLWDFGEELQTARLRTRADRGKSADNPFDKAQEKRRQAAALITDAEALEQLAYDTAEYCGGGEE